MCAESNWRTLRTLRMQSVDSNGNGIARLRALPTPTDGYRMTRTSKSYFGRDSRRATADVCRSDGPKCKHAPQNATLGVIVLWPVRMDLLDARSSLRATPPLLDALFRFLTHRQSQLVTFATSLIPTR